jgi:hypothetical protein
MADEPKGPAHSATYLPAKGVKARYGDKSDMWIERVQDRDPPFPRPAFYVGGKRFWRVADLEAWEATLPVAPPEWLAVASERAVEAAKESREEKRANKAEPVAPPARKPRLAQRSRQAEPRRAPA